MGFFNQIEQALPDPIFGLQAAFNADPRAHKVNLSVGVYKNEELKTPILESVKIAEQEILAWEMTKEYLPIDGDSMFIDRAALFVFGEQLWKDLENTIYAAQTIGGTGGLRITGEFLKQEIAPQIYLSQPTWPNHIGVFTKCGMRVEVYPYYDVENRCVDFDRFYAYLEKLPPKSVVLLHACCHNPTGADLVLEQWDKISDLFLEKELLPFFDSAYQGFGKGLEKDAEAIRLFAAKGHEMIVAASFSKNFALYSERVGALFIVAKSRAQKEHIASKIKPIIRTLYSNPPAHGARTIAYILGSPSLKAQWEKELDAMRHRIDAMRIQFAKKLGFSFLLDKVGLFSFSGLSKEQVEKLILDYAIYMTKDGRINVAGLNAKNIDYVVNAILKV